MPEKMTPEQIQNWRRALVAFFGAFSLIMPEEAIYEVRDSFQDLTNDLSRHGLLQHGEIVDLPKCEEGDKLYALWQGAAESVRLYPSFEFARLEEARHQIWKTHRDSCDRCMNRKDQPNVRIPI